MRVEVADGAVEFAADLDVEELASLTLDSGSDIRELLAERRRRGRLAVCVREHREIRVAVRERLEVDDELAQRRQNDSRAGVAQHQRIREVVDVLGRAREMNEGRQIAVSVRGAVQLVAQEVLDGLDVVIGLALERLYTACVVEAELIDDVVEHVLHRRVHRAQLDDRGLVGQMLEPAHLDEHAIADQRVLGEVFPQGRGLRRVTAVERG